MDKKMREDWELENSLNKRKIMLLSGDLEYNEKMLGLCENLLRESYHDLWKLKVLYEDLVKRIDKKNETEKN